VRRLRWEGVALVVSVIVALCAAGPVNAATTHVFLSSFGSVGSAAGELSLISSDSGIAVNSTTHDVYVADSGNSRVDEFEQDGNFVRAWGWGVADGTTEALQTCTVICFAGLSGSKPGQFETPAFVAVDNSGGPSAGDVYVGDTGDDLVSKFTATGALVESWGDSSLNGPAPQGQLDGSSDSHGNGPFGALAGIAVDSAGVLNVLEVEPHLMFRFAQDGSFVTDLETPGGSRPNGLAVDSLGDFFKVFSNGSVLEFTGSGEFVGLVTPGEEEGAIASGVAAAGSDLFVAESGAVKHYAFTGESVVSEPGGASCNVAAAPCAASDSFGSGHLGGASGIGVDSSSETVYAADASVSDVDAFEIATLPGVVTGTASARQPSAAVLNGTVNPEGVALTECQFEYVTQQAFEATGYSDLSSGGIAPCVPSAAQLPSDSQGHAVSAEITGLIQGETYHFRLTAGNERSGAVPGSDQTVTTTTAPKIEHAAVANLTATTADLNAEIDPDNGETSYHLEYGTTTSYGTPIPIPDKDIGEGAVDVAVSQHVTGLVTNTTYHWRVVATNAAGTTTGLDHTFIHDENASGLPDGRAYEMVTPPDKNGSLIGNFIFAIPPDISADGSRVILGTVQCFDGAESCSAVRQSVGTIYAFTRTASGWTTTPLAPPATQFPANTWWLANAETETANADTATALFSMPTSPGGEDDFYARLSEGSFEDIGPLSPPSGGPDLDAVQETQQLAATADLSHIVYRTGSIWPNSGSEGRALFEYTTPGSSQPALVGVTGGALGSGDLISACGTRLGDDGPGSGAALSAEGHIVYFTTLASLGGGPCLAGTGANAGHPVPVEELYARVDNNEVGAHTVAISEPQAPQVAGEPAEYSEPQDDCTSTACRENTGSADEANWRAARFQGASSDGSEAFFTSGQQLTDQASEDPDEADRNVFSCFETVGENGCNLYLYDAAGPAGHRLIDASETAAHTTVPGGPRVQGVIAFSSDGSHVYFVAKGVLTEAERPGCKAEWEAAGRSGEALCHASEGAENLYVFQHEPGQTTGHVAFVTALPASDPTLFNQLETPDNPANVTPDGRFLVLTSNGTLTADDTRTDGARQVFRYDAETGQLVRISIGELGFNDNGNAGAGDASIVPGFRGYARLGAGRPNPTMSKDGSYVFFMSPVALTPKALSSVQIGADELGRPLYAQNVYEYHDGKVSLISDGRDTSTGPDEACLPSISSVCLIGSDESGHNVFFTTADPLVRQDTDTELDFYDARICEVESPCIEPTPASQPPCLGEACHGTPPPTPSLLSPGSALFSGTGNFAPIPAVATKPKPKPKKCKKGFVKKHNKCVRAKAKHKGKGSKGKRASNTRRGRS
jgi:hypothetical protein